jgi:hypothetical protein
VNFYSYNCFIRYKYIKINNIKLTKKEITHQENEKIYYNGTFFNPNYNLKLSEKIFIKIIKNFKNKKKEKDYHFYNYNCLNIVFQDLFWQYCSNYIKYSNLIKKIGIFKKVNDKKEIFLFAGYSRIKKYFINELPLKNRLRANLKIIYLYFWTIKNYLLLNSNKIWVTKELFENFRFDLKNKIKQNFLIINFNLDVSYSNRSKNINDAILYHTHSRLDKLNHWLFSINLLRPKKIILLDNLYNDYSILLAAKKSNIKSIGISHGVASKYHKGLFGLKKYKDKNYLKFDNLYVMDKVYKKNLIKNGNLYKKNEIKISGLLGKNYKRVKRKSYKLILYPFEFLTNFKSINRTLCYFTNKGYKLIIKRRPDINNYGQFENLKFDLVDDFTEEHFRNTLCIVGLSSSIIFEMSFTGLPIVTPKNTNFNLYDDIKLPNQYFFDNNIENKLKNHKSKKLKNIITKEFLHEFEKTN